MPCRMSHHRVRRNDPVMVGSSTRRGRTPPNALTVSAEPGRWYTAGAEYMRGVMDADVQAEESQAKERAWELFTD